AITKPLSTALRRRDWARVRRELNNTARTFRLSYTRDQVVILGCAPFDARLLLFHILARRHRFFSHTSWAEWAGGPVPKRPRWPGVRAWWKAWFRHNCHGVFAVSQRSMLTLGRFIRHPIPGVVVHHALTPDFHAQGREDPPRAGTLRLIYVGRLVPSKGMDELLATMDRLDPERFHLTIVGYGALAERMRAACAERPHCTFRGRIQGPAAMAECYRQHDVLLLPSLRTHKWQELFGMVIIEAMACGLIPICTDHVGPCEILAGTSTPVQGEQPAGFLSSEAAFVETAVQRCRQLAADPDCRAIKRSAALAAAADYRDSAIARRWEALLATQLDPVRQHSTRASRRSGYPSCPPAH
ncbi:MAG: glycosyltransferase family 4 protein, partial [Planctomycetota bacterium]